MRRYDHNAVQVYYTFYQAVMMLITWVIMNVSEFRTRKSNKSFIFAFTAIVLYVVILNPDSSFSESFSSSDNYVRNADIRIVRDQDIENGSIVITDQ